MRTKNSLMCIYFGGVIRVQADAYYGSLFGIRVWSIWVTHPVQ